MTLTQKLAARGILTGYIVPDFKSFEPVLRDGAGKWYNILRSVMSIGVNTALVKPADMPSKWPDILDPKWKDKTGFANIDAGGTSFSFWFFLRQRYGLDAWNKAAALNPRIGYSAQPVATDLARGETVIAVDPIEWMIAGIAAGSPLKIVLPAGGPSYGIFGGITSVAPHPHAAQVWMNWITSKWAAAVLSSIGAYSIRRATPRLQPFRASRCRRPRASTIFARPTTRSRTFHSSRTGTESSTLRTPHRLDVMVSSAVRQLGSNHLNGRKRLFEDPIPDRCID